MECEFDLNATSRTAGGTYRVSMLKKHILVMLSLLAAATSGCGRQETHERYVPSTDSARVALEAALVDWREGKAPGEISRLKPIAHVIDTHRKPGQSLESFEILGEAPAEGVRCFAVLVKLSNPAAEERLRYYVVGIDPLWVFRQDDYDMLARWECKTPESEEEKKTEGSAPGFSSEEKTETRNKTENGSETRESAQTAGKQPG